MSTTTFAVIEEPKNLNKHGACVGGSLFTPYYGLGGGADVNIYPKEEGDGSYYGITLSAGVGTPSAEIHASEGYTYPIVSINVYDWIHRKLDAIMRTRK